MSRRLAYTPLHDKPFVWLDTETTGLNPNLNDIIEIAIIRVELDGTERVMATRIKMERPENAHPRALEVNGYTPEAWLTAWAPADVWQHINQSRLLHDCIVAGHNAKFDTAFLNATFERHGMKLRTDYHVYDTCTLVLEHLGQWVESISLVATCVALDIPTGGAHTALADVKMCRTVARRLARSSTLARQDWGRVIPGRLAAWKAAGKPNVWPAENPA